MRVLQVTPEFPPPLIGGGGYHVCNLTKALVQRGVDVAVFTCNVQKATSLNKVAVETQFGKVKVHRTSAFFVPGTIYPIAPKLIPLLLQEDADIIHAHGYQFFTSDAAAMVSKLKRKPLILTLHGFPRGFNELTRKVYFHLIGKKTLTSAKKIVAVSNTVAHEFIAIGVLEERICIVPNGICLEEYRQMPDGADFRKRLGITDNEKLILSIGRLEEIKGFQHLITALERIKTDVNSKLVIAGPEFTYSQQLRKLVIEKKLKDKVIFYGPINGKEKLMALTAADVAVVSSLYEGFGIFLLEAMATGKPVVATKTGIAQEVIKDGKHGFLVDSGDVEGLAARISEILKNEDLAFSMGQESKKVASLFDWKKIAEKIHLTYLQCLRC